MIKKLRMKLIALSMCSLLLVLVLILGSIHVVSYLGIVEDADAVLAILAENGGRFPKTNNHKKNPSSKPISPELPYESRYFSVLLDSGGNVVSADTGKIAAIDTTAAIGYAQDVREKGAEKGFLGDYRYARRDSESGSRIIFLDCGRSLATFRNFFFASCGISFLGLAAVFFLIVLLSGRMVKPVSESYEKQKRFITDAGHELKTPLSIINADTDVLEMDVGENEWITDIRKQTERLTALTNDLVYLSRMEEETTWFRMIDFPVSDVVTETAQSFQALAKAQNKAFAGSIRPMLTLRGDEKAIRQLVYILLDNALKYSQEGGHISMTLEKAGRSIRLEVFNTTESVLTAENLAHLFERFYRTDLSRSSRTGGHGIGLSVAKAITAAHKGKITASAQDGQSLLITVTLPV